MAERRGQRIYRCQIHYLSDRHVAQKLSQVYQWLVPRLEPGSAQRWNDLLTSAQHEKNRRHLRSSFF